MNRYQLFVRCFLGVAAIFLFGCTNGNLVDINIEMPQRNWSYVNKVKASVDIKDASKPYKLYFRLRNTADYGYSNVFVLLHIKPAGQKKLSKRYEFKVAEADGKWLGSGSGNLFTHNWAMLTQYYFPAAGRYEIEVEQNMRDNPLKEVSDAGLSIALDER